MSVLLTNLQLDTDRSFTPYFLPLTTVMDSTMKLKKHPDTVDQFVCRLFSVFLSPLTRFLFS